MQQIYEFLCRVSIRTVVIVNNGSPVGVITRGSLLRWASNVFRSEHLDREPIEGNHTCDASGCESPRDRILRTARAVAGEGSKLASLADDENIDLMPCVVGGASRIQELVTDLLACSRYANDATDDDQSHEAESVLGQQSEVDPVQQGVAGLAAWAALQAEAKQS